jgi:hypothetical protein
MAEAPTLRLIKGGHFRETRLGETRLVVTERPYRRASAVCFEENTALSMSGAFAPGYRTGSGLFSSRPAGGTAILRKGDPLAFYLVVNERGRAVSYRRGWLESAWNEALRSADKLGAASLSAPLIGCIGGAAVETAVLTVAHVLQLNRYHRLRVVELACGGLAEAAFAVLKTANAHPVRH